MHETVVRAPCGGTFQEGEVMPCAEGPVVVAEHPIGMIVLDGCDQTVTVNSTRSGFVIDLVASGTRVEEGDVIAVVM